MNNTLDTDTMSIVYDELETLLNTKALQMTDGMQALALLRERLWELEKISVSEQEKAIFGETRDKITQIRKNIKHLI